MIPGWAHLYTNVYRLVPSTRWRWGRNVMQYTIMSTIIFPILRLNRSVNGFKPSFLEKFFNKGKKNKESSYDKLFKTCVKYLPK